MFQKVLFVRRQDDRASAFSFFPQHPRKEPKIVAVHPVGGLVQQKKLWSARQGRGQGQALLFPITEGMDRPVSPGGQMKFVQEFRRRVRVFGVN